jgi:para-aminobenzoate synthetase/4-amino-4-deoxychorismate lyase
VEFDVTLGLAPWGRFDDLVDGTALLFRPCQRELAAIHASEVVPLLAEVEAASERGWWAFGYVAYEAAAGLDADLPVVATSGGDGSGDKLPLAWFGLCRSAAEVPPVPAPADGPQPYTAGAWVPTWSRPAYRDAFGRVKEALAAGRTYQCNLTTAMESSFSGDTEDLYRHLIHAQRGHYGAYLDLGRHVIASASPELFFEWAGGELRTRPMKGTAPRGRNTAEDARQRARLLDSPKERAENVIIVDLLRNDLSRVAETGTVAVTALLTPERYETVWQLTSDITAATGSGIGLVDVFRALFPCGSVTGAPKISTMGLIKDLEARERGVYCGAIGVVAPRSARYRARFSVAIRTVHVDRGSRRSSYGVGSGLTWSSDPDSEYDEIQAKAAILHHRTADFQLLETMLYIPGAGIRNLGRHIGRLADSAAYFGFPLSAEEARRRVLAAADGADRSRIRLLLSRDGSMAAEVSAPPAAPDRDVRLAVDLDPIDSGQAWFLHKTTRRTPYAVRAARHPDADDVVMVNEHGHVTETTVANIAVRLDGLWFTPPTSDGCLPGVERGRLIEMGLLHERSLSIADLHAATAIALVSSLRGWRSGCLLAAGQARVSASGTGGTSRAALMSASLRRNCAG